MHTYMAYPISFICSYNASDVSSTNIFFLQTCVARVCLKMLVCVHFPPNLLMELLQLHARAIPLSRRDLTNWCKNGGTKYNAIIDYL